MFNKNYVIMSTPNFAGVNTNKIYAFGMRGGTEKIEPCRQRVSKMQNKAAFSCSPETGEPSGRTEGMILSLLPTPFLHGIAVLSPIRMFSS